MILEIWFWSKSQSLTFQRANDQFSLADDFLEKLQFKAWNWTEANLRVQDDPLRHERENFGVQQLPLFNLLTPEELDW